MELHINLVGRKNLSGEIYRQIRRAIADGRLRRGDCLPASRDLARSLQTFVLVGRTRRCFRTRRGDVC